jgi:hypothetical protein
MVYPLLENEKYKAICPLIIPPTVLRLGQEGKADVVIIITKNPLLTNRKIAKVVREVEGNSNRRLCSGLDTVHYLG